MKKLNTLDKVLVILGIFLFAFILSTIIIYTIKDWQFDTLITMVLGGSGIECIVTGLITISKYKRGDKDDADFGSDTAG